VAKGVRMIVVPASREEYMKALRAGLVERFMEAGAMVESACCGPCMGGSFGCSAQESAASPHRTGTLWEGKEAPSPSSTWRRPPLQELAPSQGISQIQGSSS